MTAGVYIDTSALAKWYLNEARSEEFETFIRGQRSAAISRLTVVEFRCLLARRRRSREIGRLYETEAFSTFEADIHQGVLSVHPLEDRHAVAAGELILRLRDHPIRSLDALHLAIALGLKSKSVATADRIFARAAVALGMDAIRFD